MGSAGTCGALLSADLGKFASGAGGEERGPCEGPSAALAWGPWGFSLLSKQTVF